MAGVNQRRLYPPSCGTRNAVSERFISRATSRIQRSSGGLERMHTAAGFPANGWLVKASTCVMAMPIFFQFSRRTSVADVACEPANRVIRYGKEILCAVPESPQCIEAFASQPVEQWLAR